MCASNEKRWGGRESERQSSVRRQQGLIEADERAARGWWVGQREGGGDTHYRGRGKFSGMCSGCGETPLPAQDKRVRNNRSLGQTTQGQRGTEKKRDEIVLLKKDYGSSMFGPVEGEERKGDEGCVRGRGRGVSVACGLLRPMGVGE